MKNINEILHQIQISLSVPKTRYNKFGNYNYRNAEDIVDAIKSFLPDGIYLLLSDEVVMLGNRFYIKATASLESKEGKLLAYGWAREPEEQKGMSAGQVTGASSSYARKYALNGLFAIDDGVDADSQDNTAKTTAKTIEPSLEANRQGAEKFTNSYLIELANCTLDNLVQLTTKHNASLKRIHSNYPDLSKVINAAIETKRNAI